MSVATLLDMTLTTTPATPVLGPINEEQQQMIIDHMEEKCLRLHQPEINGIGPLNGTCRPTWDGMLCWGRVAAGEIAKQACPWYIQGINVNESATKMCTSSGIWFIPEGRNKPWTNYSSCYTAETTVIINITSSQNLTYSEKYLVVIKTIAEVGYSLSLISLLVALFILASIKKLRCPRNVLHMHLFVSFIMRALMTILKGLIFTDGVGMASDIVMRNGVKYFNSQNKVNWLCRMFISIREYFIMGNYSWILMEGLYLHNLIFLALFTDSSSIIMYIALGWGLPAIFVIAWVICKALLDNHLCWTMHEHSMISLLITVPSTLSIAINFLLFINIIRVLLLKLKSSVSEETKTYRRWAKSTLVLVPLFGVHYMLFYGLRLSTNPIVEVVWLFCDQLFASFNGFFVALLYCFLNGEVRTELSKKWNHFSLPEVLQGCPFSGNDHMSNGVMSGRAGRFLGMGRQRHPRGSCYSSTSFTTVSVLPAGHCCNPTKKRQPPPLTEASSVTARLQEAKEPLSIQFPGGRDADDDYADKLSSQTKEITSNMGQDRRWSVSDCDIHNNGMELRNITSKSYSVKL